MKTKTTTTSKTKKIKAHLSVAGIPVGTIIAFAGEENRIPIGWKLCNGEKLDKIRFPDLFNAIGTVWGGTGTPYFYLPDLRGLFLRGVAGTSKADPDKNGRLSPRAADSPASPGNQGNAVGSFQADQFISHLHSYGTFTGITGSVGGGPGMYAGASTPANTHSSGGSETRPKNAYVNYLIKVDD